MCERALEVVDHTGEARFAAAGPILKVIVREYRRSILDHDRHRCLDIIDRMCELRAFGIEAALSHDRA
jgi:hypothetical protein